MNKLPTIKKQLRNVKRRQTSPKLNKKIHYKYKIKKIKPFNQDNKGNKKDK